MSKRIDTSGGSSLAINPFDVIPATGLPRAGHAAAVRLGAGPPKAPVKRGRVELRREKGGRGGKTVTTLSAFASHLPLAELAQLAFDLKQSCACGGTLKGRVIELQGDVREKALAELQQRGFQPVLAGG